MKFLGEHFSIKGMLKADSINDLHFALIWLGDFLYEECMVSPVYDVLSESSSF